MAFKETIQHRNSKARVIYSGKAHKSGASHKMAAYLRMAYQKGKFVFGTIVSIFIKQLLKKLMNRISDSSPINTKASRK